MKAEIKSQTARRGIAKILPYPLLSLSILVMWLLLSGVSAGQFLLGLVIALICGQAMARLDQPKLKIAKPHLLIILLCRAAWDIMLSNLAVAKIILTRGRRKNPSGFITLHLALRNPMAVALLACILAATPGTAWIAYDHISGRLILHILDLPENTDWQDIISRRYENLLLQMFI